MWHDYISTLPANFLRLLCWDSAAARLDTISLDPTFDHTICSARAGGGRCKYPAPCPWLIRSGLDLASPARGRIGIPYLQHVRRRSLPLIAGTAFENNIVLKSMLKNSRESAWKQSPCSVGNCKGAKGQKALTLTLTASLLGAQ
jgi:hypothetical protein